MFTTITSELLQSLDADQITINFFIPNKLLTSILSDQGCNSLVEQRTTKNPELFSLK